MTARRARAFFVALSRWSLSLSLTLVVACGGSWVDSARSSGDHVELGKRPRDFSAVAIDGRRVKLSDLLGRDVVVLAFWATYCSPCRDELTHLKTLDSLYRSKGLSIVGIAIDPPDTSDRVPLVAAQQGISFPIVLDEAGRIASWFVTRGGPPLTVLINRRGLVTQVHEGYGPGDEAPFGAEVRDAVIGAADSTNTAGP